MGIQIQLSAFGASPEDREQNRRSALKKRIFILGTTLLLAVTARLIIKDPPPPKAPDRANDVVRYFPGMLDALPERERVKLDPKVLAKMLEADENAKKGLLSQAATPFAKGSYTPTAPLSESEIEAAQYKQNLAYLLQKKRRGKELDAVPVDVSKVMLVHFIQGGYIRAENAQSKNKEVEIRVNRSLLVNLPAHLVRSINPDGLNWEEPIPKGFVRLRPAKGISITVRKEIGDQISTPNEDTDEI